jgi:hypothetical protein
LNNKLFNGTRCSSSKYLNLKVSSFEIGRTSLYVQSKGYVLYLCFFIYSCNALSNSSLIFRVEPVLFTTNFIHSVHVCLSIFMDVFVFSSISFTIPCAVNKVSGLHHNFNKDVHGIIVWRYCGNRISLLISRVSSERRQV